MASFGRQSRRNLSQVTQVLAKIAEAVVTVHDHSIICGHRNEHDQMTAYYAGNSKTKWPDSKHNDLPSKAIDFLPYPFEGYPDPNSPEYFKEIARFYAIQAAYQQEASHWGIKLRGGHDWDRDGIYTDQTFDDLGHIEIL